MFGLFRKWKLNKQVKKSVQAFQALWNTDYDDIWNIEDKNRFLSAIDGCLCRKCNYGDEIGKLTQAERVFYVNCQLEGEVNNGGFSQFFFNTFNTYGEYFDEIATSLREIGANEMAEICETALAVLGGNIPEDWNERQNMLDDLPDSADEIWSECDTAFYAYPEDLEELNYRFIMKNKAQFTPA